MPWNNTSAVAGHCIDIDGDWWHEPGCCEGARVNCDGNCCQAPTIWRWVRCHDNRFHVFDSAELKQADGAWSRCGIQAIDMSIFRVAHANGGVRSVDIPWSSCDACRRHVEDEFRAVHGEDPHRMSTSAPSEEKR